MLLVQCSVAACALLACANVTSAQELAPGYAFAEVTDETDQPVSGAVAVVHNEAGDEIGSSVTTPEGLASLVMNGYEKKSFIVRVIKRGYVTYEGEFKTTGAHYENIRVKIQLVPLSKPRSKTRAERRASSTLKRPPTPAGPSPPRARRTRTARSRASPSRFLHAYPTEAA
jgi:hypothetical protein